MDVIEKKPINKGLFDDLSNFFDWNPYFILLFPDRKRSRI
ncbi:hypothetical protein HMPREF9406_2931 [Clostridium sp. HGF2]|nr:hypothetical protein HMPREF9406_2931 [Clostridium sp. HGF2]EQJ49390.1 hypothetical protein QSI_4626 [Clostridioides difficile P28]